MYNYCFRLRNAGDLDAFLEENSGTYDKKTLMKMYKYCVDYEPFSIMYCDMRAKTKERMFMRKFDAYIVPIQNGTE